MPNLNNDFWRLQLELRFVHNRPPIYEIVKCPNCMSGSMFCQIADEVCNTCGGLGSITKRVDFPKPPAIPDDLLKHMREAYQKYLATPANEVSREDS